MKYKNAVRAEPFRLKGKSTIDKIVYLERLEEMLKSKLLTFCL